MSGIHTPGPWQASPNACDAIVAAYPAHEMQSDTHAAHYGGYLIAESIAPKNRPILIAAPTMFRRLERVSENERGLALQLEACITVCRVNGLLDTARTLEHAAEQLRASAGLNSRVIAKARGVDASQTTKETANAENR